MGKTGIEWTDVTWNPVRGCSRVSDGCRHCYAEVQAARIVRMGKGKPTAYDGLVRLVGGEPRWTGEVRLVLEQLAAPLKWRKPQRVFVNSMSDLFHEKLTNEQIAAVFGVMASCPQHTFQVLTKRARRMRDWFKWVSSTGYAPGHVLSTALADVAERDQHSDARFGDDEWLVGLINVVNGRSSWAHHDDGNPLDGSRPRWPLPNVWLGVSVENQAAAEDRIPDLQRTPAAVRFLSIEPMLGPVTLPIVHVFGATPKPPGIDWVIVGCESGSGARECDVSVLLSLQQQCADAGVAFFAKQWRRVPGVVEAREGSHVKPGGVIGAPYLDGVQHLAFPEVSHD